MRARGLVEVGARLRLVEDPPLGFRVTPDGVYQVGTAGGPVGDDDLELRVVVAPGRHLRLRAVAATVVLAGTGTRQRTTIEVGAGGSLDWCPQPVIASRGCRHRQETMVSLADGATIDLTEVLLLGRHGEAPGRLGQRLDVDVGGVPLLRHEIAVGPDARGWSGPAVLDGDRAVGLRLVAGGSAVTWTPTGATTGPGWAWCDLDGPAWLLLATAADLPALRTALAAAAAAGPTGHDATHAACHPTTQRAKSQRTARPT